MKKFAAVLAALVVLVLPSAAQADGSFYSHAARAYWGGNPPCGDPVINYWVWGGLAGYSQPCQIWVNSAAFSSWPAGRACMIVLHEWGHLRGHGDDYWNSGSVMYYRTDPWNNIPYVRWPCGW